MNGKAKRGEYVPAMNYALAFSWLAKAEHERNAPIFEVTLDPVYDGPRADPRFQDLLRRVGLP